MALYRLSLRYEAAAPVEFDSALADEPAAVGSLFYGQHGRAIVLRCNRASEAAPPRVGRLVLDRPGFWRIA